MSGVQPVVALTCPQCGAVTIVDLRGEWKWPRCVKCGGPLLPERKFKNPNGEQI